MTTCTLVDPIFGKPCGEPVVDSNTQRCQKHSVRRSGGTPLNTAAAAAAAPGNRYIPPGSSRAQKPPGALAVRAPIAPGFSIASSAVAAPPVPQERYNPPDLESFSMRDEQKDEEKAAPSAVERQAIAQRPVMGNGGARAGVSRTLAKKNYEELNITPAMTAIMDEKINRSPNFQFVLIGSDNPYATLIADILALPPVSAGLTLHCYSLDLVNQAERAPMNFASHGVGSSAVASAAAASPAATAVQSVPKFNKWTWPENKIWLEKALQHKPKAVFVVHRRCLAALIQCSRGDSAEEAQFMTCYYANSAPTPEGEDPTFSEVFHVLQTGYRKLLYSTFGKHVVARLERVEDGGAAASAASAAPTAPARENCPGEKPTVKGVAIAYVRQRRQ